MTYLGGMLPQSKRIHLHCFGEDANAESHGGARQPNQVDHTVRQDSATRGRGRRNRRSHRRQNLPTNSLPRVPHRKTEAGRSPLLVPDRPTATTLGCERPTTPGPARAEHYQPQPPHWRSNRWGGGGGERPARLRNPTGWALVQQRLPAVRQAVRTRPTASSRDPSNPGVAMTRVHSSPSNSAQHCPIMYIL